jgi:hypothetical protein
MNQKRHLYSFYQEDGSFYHHFQKSFSKIKKYWSGVHSLQTGLWLHGCYGKVKSEMFSLAILILKAAR